MIWYIFKTNDIQLYIRSRSIYILNFFGFWVELKKFNSIYVIESDKSVKRYFHQNNKWLLVIWLYLTIVQNLNFSSFFFNLTMFITCSDITKQIHLFFIALVKKVIPNNFPFMLLQSCISYKTMNKVVIIQINCSAIFYLSLNVILDCFKTYNATGRWKQSLMVIVCDNMKEWIENCYYAVWNNVRVSNYNALALFSWQIPNYIFVI